jgi:branched-chain amino acid transport system ATP-binding protein
MLLEVKDIRLHYGLVEALKGISFKVEQGQVVALIGANGGGKTSTLMAISGLVRLTSGEIHYDGIRIDQLTPDKIVSFGIAHVPQGRRIFPHMSVLDNLLMGAYARKDSKEINRDIEEIQKHFSVLLKRRRQKAGTLSGGEQQMLAIARALMSKPKLLLLDEPTLGLSPLIAEELVDLILDINRRAVSILLVEQNTRIALRLAQKVCVLQKGEIVLSGAAGELLKSDRVGEAYLGR